MSQQVVKISQIRENPNALRTVNRQSEDYISLRDAVHKYGVLQPILVRECKDATTGELYYSLIDGLHRFKSSVDLGLDTIPVMVKEMAEVEVMIVQMVNNVQRIETKPVEYSKQLVRIMSLEPTLTAVDLAERLKKSPGWINDRLGLTKLTDNIGSLVDEGKINLVNAYALSKLPPEEQANYLDKAMTLQPKEFMPQVSDRVKELRDAKRQGRDSAPKTFEPVAYVRKVSELKDEAEKKEVARVLTQGVNDPVTAFQLGVMWTLNLDPISAQAQRDKDAIRQKELADAKERRKKERDAQKEKEAAEKTAQIQSELATVA